jgi:hypothetical protein
MKPLKKTDYGIAGWHLVGDCINKKYCSNNLSYCYSFDPSITVFEKLPEAGNADCRFLQFTW